MCEALESSYLECCTKHWAWGTSKRFHLLPELKNIIALKLSSIILFFQENSFDKTRLFTSKFEFLAESKYSRTWEAFAYETLNIE